MKSRSFASVWNAIESDPEESENLRLRSQLMIGLRVRIERSGMTQAQAAARLGVTQPRISDLMRGKIELFSLDTLVNMAHAAGLKVQLKLTATARIGEAA